MWSSYPEIISPRQLKRVLKWYQKGWGHYNIKRCILLGLLPSVLENSRDKHIKSLNAKVHNEFNGCSLTDYVIN